MAIDNSVWLVIISTLGAAVSGLFVQIAQYIREGRQHQWMIDQSRFEQRERIRIASELKTHTDQKADSLAVKLDENKEMNRVAIDTANGYNEKILAIGQVRLTGSPDDRK